MRIFRLGLVALLGGLVLSCSGGSERPDVLAPALGPTVQTATATSTPAGRSPVMSKPPIARTSYGNATALMGIGSYCWTNVCLDAMGPVTTMEALAVPPGVRVSIETQFSVVAAAVSALPATGQPSVTPSGELIWNFPPVGGLELRVVAGTTGVIFDAPTTPGRYVISAFLQAQGGDVAYGVILEVALP